MIQKESYGFNTFAAVRVGEIQEGTNTKDWYWTASEFNVADLLTRGSKPNDIDINSKWQKGPDFLKLHESEWPITKTYSEQKIPINTINWNYLHQTELKNDCACSLARAGADIDAINYAITYTTK